MTKDTAAKAAEPRMDKASAEAEFDRFLEAMDIIADTSEMDEEDLTGFRKQKNRVVKALQGGHLVINDDGEALYTPWRTSVGQLHFHERTGASIMAMDGKKKGHDVKKMYAVMGDLCKVETKLFAGLKGPDIKTCEALFALLMD